MVIRCINDLQNLRAAQNLLDNLFKEIVRYVIGYELNTLTKVLIGVAGVAILGLRWTFYGVKQFGNYTGPDTSNWPSIPGFTEPKYNASQYGNDNSSSTTNTTQPVQSNNPPKSNSSKIPTIGEVLSRSNAGFSYALATEEETPEPWASDALAILSH
jgi:hypothetical protein